MSYKSCEDCKYSHKEGELLFCHRFPPIPFVSGDSLNIYTRAEFPHVAVHDWCGEFSEKVEHERGNQSA